MPKPIPIYKDHDEIYRADSCQALIRGRDMESVRLEALRHGHYPGRALPPGALPGIKMVGYWDAERDQEWGLDWHRNEGLELALLERGRLGFGLENKSYELDPGTLTITRPWQRHRVGDPNVAASRLIWVIIDLGVRRPNERWKWPAWIFLSKPDIDELTNILRHTEQPTWRGSSEVRRCFHALAEAISADRDGSHVSHLSLRINELFLLVLEMLRTKDVQLDPSLSSTRRTVELFLRDLRAHAENLELKWTLEEMSHSCGLRVTQFVHHVRFITNMSPLHYLNHCRLDMAAKILRESGERSITDLALSCGFSSSQYFATAFYRRFALSPTEFRHAKSSLLGNIGPETRV